MQKARYFCDQCKKEVENSKELFDTEARLFYPIPTRRKFTYFKKELCESCLNKIGITKLPENSTKETVDAQEESIQNKLFNIIAEIIRGETNCLKITR